MPAENSPGIPWGNEELDEHMIDELICGLGRPRNLQIIVLVTRMCVVRQLALWLAVIACMQASPLPRTTSSTQNCLGLRWHSTYVRTTLPDTMGPVEGADRRPRRFADDGGPVALEPTMRVECQSHTSR
ncbi:hypothetical protein DHEL01_v210003 [Diaporthe helianthi]|uniref:Uncharacterized protein n=1 Tax=Diaporthe helianthi TaxID=158607 RepID=A0A2P5HMX8_DIAHE|nr:hypothetical protein DHEL01_v210003 [Diaporthe helianthi]